MNYILYDGAYRAALLPLTFTRPVAEIRIGILTIKEKWEKLLGTTVTYLTEPYLETKYPMVEFEQNIFIDASIIPTKSLAEEISFLNENQAIIYKGEVIAFFAENTQEALDFNFMEMIAFSDELLRLDNLPAIFKHNFKAIALDYELLTSGKTSAKISATNNIIGTNQVFLEAGATVEYATINATEGPVYIGKNSLVMEGSLIRGPFVLGEKSVVKMGARIYGGTTVGPNCTVAGEIKNVMFIGNSNKGHDGYLGNSVVGEYCNFGADTNCSNMKNNHSTIALWNYEAASFVNSEEQFCGVFIGDYTKLGINTMLNTGTVCGVSSNVFGSGFPEKYIPSFTWGSGDGKKEYQLNKAIADAKKMMQLKQEELTEVDANILRELFQMTLSFRN